VLCKVPLVEPVITGFASGRMPAVTNSAVGQPA
jgi:hypothetical protein